MAFKDKLILNFFWIYATGSGRKYKQTLKFNPAHQELSIEVRNITVALVEAEFLKFLLIGATMKNCAARRDFNLRATSIKFVFFQTTI